MDFPFLSGLSHINFYALLTIVMMIGLADF